MRILHLISNFKFTGPVDPALLVAEGMRSLPGVSLLVGIGKPPWGEPDRYAGAIARERGLPLWETRSLGKHRRFFLEPLDRRRLRRTLREFTPDVVHTHVGNDLRLAARTGAGPLVHSIYADDLEALPPVRRRLVTESPAGLVVHSRRLLEELASGGRRVLHVPPPLDTNRFDPDREMAAGREAPILRDRVAVGVVARMQRYRQFDLLLESFRAARDERPELVLVVVGRGTWAREVVREPVKRLGLENDVIFPGYVTGDEYVALLKAFAIFVFLVPGTDGTCRALREAMAMGTAIVGSRRGMIPELLGDGAAGLLAEETVDGLAGAMTALARDEALRAGLSQEARRRAVSFRAEAVAEKIHAFYADVMARR